jgi:hypothetical protein
MATLTSQMRRMEKYVFSAKAVAAHFSFTNGHPDFGDEFTLTYHSEAPGEVQRDTGSRTGPEISFTNSSVHISCAKGDGVYTTIVRSALQGLNVHDVLTADSLECGLMTVYREEWYGDPARPKRARAIPLPAVIRNLQVHGTPFRPGEELRLPEHFSYDDARRARYLNGEGPEIEPVGVSTAPGSPVPTPRGHVEVSADKRRITIPKFGIVDFADWMWQPPDTRTPARTAQSVQMIRLDLKNPGSGGASRVSGNGSPFGS